ncbi:MAG: hypothetical protein P8X75_11095 [Limibacillus sp.]
MSMAIKRLRNGLRLALGMELEPGDVNKKMLLPCNVIRAPKPAEKRTLIVLGMPSGGTSMTAGALRIMGVNMGDDYDDANQEDYEFPRLAASLQPLHDSKGRPIDSKFEELRKLVRRRNEEKAVWGFKDPHSRLYIQEIYPALRNPHFLMIFRDHMAAAQRINFRSQTEHLDSIEAYLDHQMQLVRFVKSNKAPLLLISYERALRLRESFARQVAEFAGLELDEETLSTVMHYIRPDRGGGNIDASYLATDKAFWRAREIKNPGK